MRTRRLLVPALVVSALGFHCDHDERVAVEGSPGPAATRSDPSGDPFGEAFKTLALSASCQADFPAFDNVPYSSITRTTTGAKADYKLAAKTTQCGGQSDGKTTDLDRDVVFQFVAPAEATYRFTITPTSGFASGLRAFLVPADTCAPVPSLIASCAGGAANTKLAPLTFATTSALARDQVVFLVVEGVAAKTGNFKLGVAVDAAACQGPITPAEIPEGGDARLADGRGAEFTFRLNGVIGCRSSTCANEWQGFTRDRWAALLSDPFDSLTMSLHLLARIRLRSKITGDVFYPKDSAVAAERAWPIFGWIFGSPLFKADQHLDPVNAFRADLPFTVFEYARRAQGTGDSFDQLDRVGSRLGLENWAMPIDANTADAGYAKMAVTTSALFGLTWRSGDVLLDGSRASKLLQTPEFEYSDMDQAFGANLGPRYLASACRRRPDSYLSADAGQERIGTSLEGFGDNDGAHGGARLSSGSAAVPHPSSPSLKHVLRTCAADPACTALAPAYKLAAAIVANWSSRESAVALDVQRIDTLYAMRDHGFRRACAANDVAALGAHAVAAGDTLKYYPPGDADIGSAPAPVKCAAEAAGKVVDFAREFWNPAPAGTGSSLSLSELACFELNPGSAQTALAVADGLGRAIDGLDLDGISADAWGTPYRHWTLPANRELVSKTDYACTSASTCGFGQACLAPPDAAHANAFACPDPNPGGTPCKCQCANDAQCPAGSQCVAGACTGLMAKASIQAVPWRENGVQRTLMTLADGNGGTAHKRLPYDTGATPALAFQNDWIELTKRVRKRLACSANQDPSSWLPNINTSMNYMSQADSPARIGLGWTQWMSELELLFGSGAWHEKFNVLRVNDAHQRLAAFQSLFAAHSAAKHGNRAHMMISYFNYQDGDPDYDARNNDAGDEASYVFGLAPGENFESGLVNYLLAADRHNGAMKLELQRRTESNAVAGDDETISYGRLTTLLDPHPVAPGLRSWLRVFLDLRLGLGEMRDVANITGPIWQNPGEFNRSTINPGQACNRPGDICRNENAWQDRYSLLYTRGGDGLALRNLLAPVAGGANDLYVQLPWAPASGGSWLHYYLPGWDSNATTTVPLHRACDSAVPGGVGAFVESFVGAADGGSGGEFIRIPAGQSVLLVSANALMSPEACTVTPVEGAARPHAAGDLQGIPEGRIIRDKTLLTSNIPWTEDPASLVGTWPSLDGDGDGVATNFDVNDASAAVQ